MAGKPYQGVSVLLLWGEAMGKGYVSPFWMTFKHALELGARVRKGEHGSPVVYADTLRMTEVDKETGEEMERAIPFMKGYTVFSVEQIEDLPDRYYAQPADPLPVFERLEHADRFFVIRGRISATVATGLIMQSTMTIVRCHPLRRSAMQSLMRLRLPMRQPTEHAIRHA